MTEPSCLEDLAEDISDRRNLNIHVRYVWSAPHMLCLFVFRSFETCVLSGEDNSSYASLNYHISSEALNYSFWTNALGLMLFILYYFKLILYVTLPQIMWSTPIKPYLLHLYTFPTCVFLGEDNSTYEFQLSFFRWDFLLPHPGLMLFDLRSPTYVNFMYFNLWFFKWCIMHDARQCKPHLRRRPQWEQTYLSCVLPYYLK